MTIVDSKLAPAVEKNTALSLYHLLDPEGLANPHPLFHRLRMEDPVHWDPFVHAWVVTRYADILTVLHNFLAYKPAAPEQLAVMGLSSLNPVTSLMMKQMLFMDPPVHTRLRSLAAQVFTPRRMETLRSHIHDVVSSLLDQALSNGGMDVIADLAEPLPATITAEMLGVPVSDIRQLKEWSADFAEMLGSFQHSPDRIARVLESVDGMTAYFHRAIQEQSVCPREGLIRSLLTAEIDGDRLTADEVVATCIITMIGGQETTTNLIGNGLLALAHNPDVLKELRGDLSLVPLAIEELLRYEAPSQYTFRLAPYDFQLGGKTIRKGQTTIAVIAAGNRDPERFPDPDRLDIHRKDNRHLAFGWASHFCFGAPLARVEGQVTLEALLRRLPDFTIESEPPVWRLNWGLRGLKALEIRFKECNAGAASSSVSDLRPCA